MKSCLGVDVARYGSDASAISLWWGYMLERVYVLHQLDTMTLADTVANLIEQYRVEHTCIDVIGIGAGVVDRLKQLGCKGIEGVNVSMAPSDPNRFVNLRAEMFWTFREAFRAGIISLPEDEGTPALIREITEFKYFYDSAGRLRIEAKDELRRRLGKSPDRADACALGFWAVTGKHTGRRFGCYFPGMEELGV